LCSLLLGPCGDQQAENILISENELFENTPEILSSEQNFIEVQHTLNSLTDVQFVF
jgi:hypothetical protein